jgi:hypothetical protein
MPERYEWISGGGTLHWPANNTATNVDLYPINGTTLRRFQLVNVRIQGKNAGTTADIVEQLAMHQEVLWPATSSTPTTLWHATRSLPMHVEGFFADLVDIYNVWWNGADQDFGFNEKCSRTGFEHTGAPVRFRWYPLGLGTFNYEDLILMDYTFRALYSYLAP